MKQINIKNLRKNLYYRHHATKKEDCPSNPLTPKPPFNSKPSTINSKLSPLNHQL